MVRRRGISLMEIAAAGILLAAMLTVCVQFFRATAGQRLGLQARRTAIQEACNVMERLCARPWEALTPEAAGEVQRSEGARRALPDGELQVEVTPSDENPEAKRIAVVVRWPGGPEQPDRSVRLVAWKYRAGGE